jgi:hypothetical protein
MKTILGAFALAFAVPAAAQTAPAADPHAGHAGHAAPSLQPAPSGNPSHDHHATKPSDCCKDAAAKKGGCCKEMAAKKEGCCADKPAH